MVIENAYSKCQRLIKILWHYKTFHFASCGYSLLISLSLILFFGGIHYEFVEDDIKIEELNYSNSLKEEVHKIIKSAIESKDFTKLNYDWRKYRSKMLLIVQDYYNFKIYFHSHAEYNFITSKKQLEFFILESGEAKYEISVYTLHKKTWESVYKHWLKYFTRSFKPGSKYKYLTEWLFIIYPLTLLILLTNKAWLRTKGFRRYRKTI